MGNFYSADFHFGHANIIKYCNRPFKTLEEMDDTIIRNYNQRVKSEDTVFFLGDFAFKNSPGGKTGEGTPIKARYYEEKLNGKLIPICGNHDRNNGVKTPIEKIILKYGGLRICLVHNPLHADSKYELNFVGHVHDKWKFRPLGATSYMVNVGVDQWNFQPIKFEEIISELNKWKKRKIAD